MVGAIIIAIPADVQDDAAHRQLRLNVCSGRAETRWSARIATPSIRAPRRGPGSSTRLLERAERDGQPCERVRPAGSARTALLPQPARRSGAIRRSTAASYGSRSSARRRTSSAASATSCAERNASYILSPEKGRRARPRRRSPQSAAGQLAARLPLRQPAAASRAPRRGRSRTPRTSGAARRGARPSSAFPPADVDVVVLVEDQP